MREWLDSVKEAVSNCGDKISNFFSVIIAICFFLVIIESILYICKLIEKARKKN